MYVRCREASPVCIWRVVSSLASLYVYRVFYTYMGSSTHITVHARTDVHMQHRLHTIEGGGTPVAS